VSATPSKTTAGLAKGKLGKTHATSKELAAFFIPRLEIPTWGNDRRPLVSLRRPHALQPSEAPVGRDQLDGSVRFGSVVGAVAGDVSVSAGGASPHAKNKITSTTTSITPAMIKFRCVISCLPFAYSGTWACRDPRSNIAELSGMDA
jgi:hypothetical protein